MAAAGIVTAVLLVLSVLAVQGDGLQMGNLVLALFLSFLAGILLLADFKVGKIISLVWCVALPAFQLCSIEFYTHVPGDLTAPIFFLNYLFYLVLLILMIFVTGSSRRGGQLATLVPMLFGVANYFVVQFRSSPIVPWDFLSIGVASSVAGGYTFTFTWRVVFVLEVFVFLLLLCGKTSLKVKKRPVRLTGLALAVVLMVTYVTEIKTDWVTEAAGLDTILFTPNVLYRNNGIAGAFLSNLKYIDVEKPEGYSEKAAQAIADESLQKTEETK